MQNEVQPSKHVRRPLNLTTLSSVIRIKYIQGFLSNKTSLKKLNMTCFFKLDIDEGMDIRSTYVYACKRQFIYSMFSFHSKYYIAVLRHELSR